MRATPVEAIPSWSYEIENDTEWKTGATIKITVTYDTDPGFGDLLC